MTVFYAVGKAITVPLAKGLWRPTITGRDNIPRSGGVILASNHLSFIDSFAIPIASPRPVSFLAKSDYFTGTGVSGAIRRGFFVGSQAIPVDRHSSRAAQESLNSRSRCCARVGPSGSTPRAHARAMDGSTADAPAWPGLP